MEAGSKIFVAGHRGMVGSAIVRKLQKAGFMNLIVRTSSELDLRESKAVTDFFQKKNLNTSFWRLLKWGVLLPTIPIVQSFCTIIS